MKKLIAMILSLCLLLCVAGCGGQNDASESTAATVPTSTTVPEDTAPENMEYDFPLMAVAVPSVTEYTKADDGTVISSCEYQNVSVILQDADVAEAISVDLMNRIDAAVNEIRPTLSAAKDAYTGQNDWYAYYCSILYSPVRLDSNILSFFGNEVIYDGSPRSASTNISVTYDITTGQTLSLKTLLHSDYSADDLCERIIQGLKSYADEGALFEDYEAIVEDMFSTNEQVETWYLSQEGLCFYFSPYEIGPFSSSTIISQIPYSNLSGLLKEQYFPTEEVAYTGSIEALRATDGAADTSAFTQFVEVELDETGEQVLLFTKGSVSDLMIQAGTWDEDGTEFVPTVTVLAAAALGPGDAVKLTTQFPDVMPELRLIYRSGEQLVTRFLTQSGEDGSILITE